MPRRAARSASRLVDEHWPSRCMGIARMLEPLALVGLPLAALLGVVSLLVWRKHRTVASTFLEEALAEALAFALALLALHRAADPLGAADTPLLLAGAAGGLAVVERMAKTRSLRLTVRVALLFVALFVVVRARASVEAMALGGLVSLVGYGALVLALWGGALALVPERGGGRLLVIALALGAGVSALATTMAAGTALLVGLAVALVPLVERLASPRDRPTEDTSAFVLTGALWVAALVAS